MIAEAENPNPSHLTIPPRKNRKRILYVVHRYAPYPGGSENYVRDMAEETLAGGHDVAVFAGEHMGNLHGVYVTSDPYILREPWDLIVVHGGDVAIQNFVLAHVDQLRSPILYLLILPSHSPACVQALHKVKFIGCSTLADWRHVNAYRAQHKAVKIRHGIHLENSIGQRGFKKLYGITTPLMFLSSGGYWPNKGFDELVDIFNSVGRTDTTLVLTGYDNRHGLMPKESEYVKPFLFDRRSDMLSALREADLYILNSSSEGFGLVLLEAMLNLTPWVARELAGAELMREYGHTYNTPQELLEYLQAFEPIAQSQKICAQEYILSTHQISHTVSDILRVL